MKSFLLVVIGAVLGAILTFVAASGLLIGVGAGAGIVTGLKAEACLTAEAAKAKGRRFMRSIAYGHFVQARYVDAIHALGPAFRPASRERAAHLARFTNRSESRRSA